MGPATRWAVLGGFLVGFGEREEILRGVWVSGVCRPTQLPKVKGGGSILSLPCSVMVSTRRHNRRYPPANSHPYPSFNRALDPLILPHAASPIPPLPPQGAYNQYYEDDIKAWRLPVKFNAKPFHRHAPHSLDDIVIMHFLGPKPTNYLNYTVTNICYTFSSFCEKGVKARACVFVREWVQYVEGEVGRHYREQFKEGCAKVIEKQEAEETEDKRLGRKRKYDRQDLGKR